MLLPLLTELFTASIPFKSSTWQNNRYWSLKTKRLYIYIYIYIKDIAWNLVFVCVSVALLERGTREKNHVWKRKTRFLKKIMQNYIYYMQGQEYEYVFRLIWFFFFFLTETNYNFSNLKLKNKINRRIRSVFFFVFVIIPK